MFSWPLNSSTLQRCSAVTMLAASLSTGCGADDEKLARVGSTIYGGMDAGSEENGAVVIMQNWHGAIGTGALVAPNLMLTTLGNVAPLTWSNFTCTEDGELENGGSGDGELGELFDPALIEVWTSPTHEFLATPEPDALGRRILATETTTVCRNNLAFVVLDRKLESLPLLPVRLEGRVKVGDLIDIVGYGAKDRNDPFRYEEMGHRRRLDGLRIDDVDIPPRTFIIGPPGPCSGDQGGPALSSETGAIVGVFSMMMDWCDVETTRNIYTELAPFRELALEAFEAAGAEPWLEGTSGPGAGGEGEGEGGGAGGQAGDSSGGAEGGTPGGGGQAGMSGEGGEPHATGTPGEPQPIASQRRSNTGCSLGANPAQPAGTLAALLTLLGLLVRRSKFLRRFGW